MNAAFRFSEDTWAAVARLLAPLQLRWFEILGEYKTALEVAPKRQVLWKEEELSDASKEWRVFGFKAFGAELVVNRKLCPITSSLIDSLPRVNIAGASLTTPGSCVDICVSRV